jgi:putative phage-type endonuclease
MNIIECNQGSQAWFEARSGKVTASRICDVMNFLKKGGEGADRRNYRAQIVAELLTGAPDMNGYLSPYMEHGTEQEPFARAAYEIQTGNSVEQLGFVVHPSIARAGASPDGLVGEDGAIEIKCPKTETHIRWLLAGIVPEEHEPQMMFVMACTGRAWCDFVSYDSRLPAALQLFTVRLMRDEARITVLEEAVIGFLAEVDGTIDALRAICGVDFALPSPKLPEVPMRDETYLTDEDFAGLL